MCIESSSQLWTLWWRWNPLVQPPLQVTGSVAMATKEPVTTLDPRFSTPGTTPTPWAEASDALGRAEIYWLTTVRADGRPHVTPLIGIWLDGAFFFCTGGEERKARNLAGNARCAVTTGGNALGEGLDLVIEGEAVRVGDGATLRRIAGAYEAKYGRDWRFEVRDGAFVGPDNTVAQVYAVAPVTAFGFGKGDSFSQTRWRF